jgi:hypothetical protein
VLGLNDADTARTSVARLICVAHDKGMRMLPRDLGWIIRLSGDAHHMGHWCARHVRGLLSCVSPGPVMSTMGELQVGRRGDLSPQSSVITHHLDGIYAFSSVQGQIIVKSIFMTIINRLPKGIKMSVKSLRALEMERRPAVLIYMIKPTPAMPAASTTPAWTTGPNEIPAVTCPALGAEEDADGKALIIS